VSREPVKPEAYGLPSPFAAMTYVVPQPKTQREAVDEKIAEVEKVLATFKKAVTRRLPKPTKKPAKRRGK